MGWGRFLHYTHFDAGIGSLIRFWHKCWRGDQPLRVVFLVLYDCATDRDMSLESLLVRQSRRRS